MATIFISTASMNLFSVFPIVIENKQKLQILLHSNMLCVCEHLDIRFICAKQNMASKYID